MPLRNLRRPGRAAVAAVALGAAAAWLPAITPMGVPAAGAAAAKVDPAIRVAGGEVSVVVQARPGRATPAAQAAARAGARIGPALPIIDGFSARLPSSAAAALAASEDVVAVTLDRAGAFQSSQSSQSSDPSMLDSAATPSSALTAATEASTAWAAGLRGTGVNVAVLDTGVSTVADTAGRVVHAPDLSGERTQNDSYGHGTVMAGIIAGNGEDSDGRHTGIAPEAGLVSVKVAGRNGAVDVSTVLQGMAWVSAYRHELGIRVLSLAYGTNSTQDPAVDPLNFAVQRLWAQGIVVVVAAGNGGPGARTITKPGDDPVVLTVGAYDDQGDATPDNDVVPAWSSQGPTVHGVAKPDLVAPGRTVVSTRSPGSAVEAQNPDALVAPTYIKGSGTSEATAVTAGLVALLLQAHPMWTPDQVKRALTSSAARFPSAPTGAAGHGRPQVFQAIWADPGPPLQQRLTATGLGSIEASRGDDHVVAGCGVIVGEVDVFCRPWDPTTWTGNGWTGNGWTGNGWTGNGWTGNGWTGNGWTGNGWTGNGWTGNGWTSASWDGGRMQTAFWGERPKAGRTVAGERSAPASP
jgi:serine protease AprX